MARGRYCACSRLYSPLQCAGINCHEVEDERWSGPKVPRFQALPSPRQSGGSKGCLRRLHFMRPFAPCFAESLASLRVYLLSLPTRFFTRRLTSSLERLLNRYPRPTIRTGLRKWGASTACTVWNIRLGVSSIRYSTAGQPSPGSMRSLMNANMWAPLTKTPLRSHPYVVLAGTLAESARSRQQPSFSLAGCVHGERLSVPKELDSTHPVLPQRL
jgi:hypothetical protein